MKLSIRNRNKFVYVQVRLEPEGYTLYFSIVSPTSSTTLQRGKSVEEVIKMAGKGLMYLIHFTGFGILTRVVENTPGYKEGLIVSGEVDDFCFNSIEYKTKLLASFARKSVLDRVMNIFQEQKAIVREVLLGPVILPDLAAGNDTYHADYTIGIENGQLTTCVRSEKPVYETYLPVAVSHSILNEHFSGALEEETVTSSLKNFREYRRFVRLGIGILSGFLIILSANYFYVNHLYQKIADLENDVSSYGDNLSRIGLLEQEKSRKLTLIENSGIRTKYFISYYLDEIAKSVPQRITLETLETFPLTDPLKPKRKVETNFHKIILTGWTPNSGVMDDWMEKIERFSWTTGVELINYVREEDNRAHFQLAIELKE